VTRWRDFEELAGRILSELAPDCEVVVDDHIPGHESGGGRQIDVSIRRHLEDDEVFVVVQARDRETPADINDVGEFASVIRDVQATKGILVCRSGFTARAKVYAQNLGIELLNLHDAESRNWRLDIRIPLLWIDLTPEVQLEVVARFQGGDQVFASSDRVGIPLSPDGGKTIVTPLATFERRWNEGTISQQPGPKHTLRDSRPLTTMVIAADGQQVWRPVEDFAITYTVRQKSWLGYVTPEICRGVVDYLQDAAFVASHLPLGQLPTERDDNWTRIDDPAEVVVRTRGTLVTSEAVVILEPGSGRMTLPTLGYLGPTEETT
jgi:hypothetical protein